LKLFQRRGYHRKATVAPRAGAWIETCISGGADGEHMVAPRAGAWIETDGGEVIVNMEISRPPRGGVD